MVAAGMIVASLGRGPEASRAVLETSRVEHYKEKLGTSSANPLEVGPTSPTASDLEL